MKLATGEGARVGVGQAGQPDPFEEVVEVEVARLLVAHAPGDVFGDILSQDEELGALADQRTPADGSEAAASRARPLARFGPGEEQREGGLARAVVSDDDRVFGTFEADGDASQGVLLGPRVGEAHVVQGEGKGGGGGIVADGVGGRGIGEGVPSGVEGDATQDGHEEPSGCEHQEGNADEAGDGNPHPPGVDDPLAEDVPGVDDCTGVGDVADEPEESVEHLLDALEAEGTQVGQEPEGHACSDAPDEAEAGCDRAHAQPGGSFPVQEADDEADERGLKAPSGRGESSDGDGKEHRGGECGR